jgi:TetR/AcrR family transcriptional regulator, cholesterol catabolism regulator
MSTAGAVGAVRTDRADRAVRVGSERRDEILAIAADLFAERGFAATTVREIADAAGILSGSLYHHFDSKESMVEELLRSFFDNITAAYRKEVASNDDPVEVLRRLVRIALGSIGDQWATAAVMVNEYNLLVSYPRFAFVAEESEETEDLWVSVIERGAASGAFRADLDARMVYRFLRDAIWVSVRWYQPHGRATPEQLADTYLGVLLDGIKTPGCVQEGDPA